MFPLIEALSSLFKRSEKTHHSQASQDRFVYLLLCQLLNKQGDGYYLEIGAGPPEATSNTLFFEKSLGWKGISIDISEEYKDAWASNRKNTLLIEDATKSDYQSILKAFPSVIDYLSLDIDGNYDLILQRIPFNTHIFKVITIEHDFYRYGEAYRETQRKILAEWGYYLLCPDVSVFFNEAECQFEDWWIHPGAFPADMFSKLISLDLKAKNHKKVIKAIQKGARAGINL